MLLTRMAVTFSLPLDCLIPLLLLLLKKMMLTTKTKVGSLGDVESDLRLDVGISMDGSGWLLSELYNKGSMSLH